MRIRIEINGHQVYREIGGEVLYWGSTVERFGQQPLNVPCAIIKKEDKEIEIVPLKTEHTWTKIKIIEET
jgi:hypothetical protein